MQNQQEADKQLASINEAHFCSIPAVLISVKHKINVNKHFTIIVSTMSRINH